MTAIDLNLAEARALAGPRAPAAPQVLLDLLAETLQVLKVVALPVGGNAPELDAATRHDLGLD